MSALGDMVDVGAKALGSFVRRTGNRAANVGGSLIEEIGGTAKDGADLVDIGAKTVITGVPKVIKETGLDNLADAGGSLWDAAKEGLEKLKSKFPATEKANVTEDKPLSKRQKVAQLKRELKALEAPKAEKKGGKKQPKKASKPAKQVKAQGQSEGQAS